ncbi:zinc finger protein 385B [Planococcus citri]|uniref:zinc finger protein 385B n=1 Tax=Planococcus citri TaxID=170843 RepID=UPI0031FA2016
MAEEVPFQELEISGARTRSFKKDKISKLAENEFKCKLCDVKLGSLIQMKSHIDGSKHKKNMEAYREKKAKLKNESSSDIKLTKPASHSVNDDKPIVVKTEPKSSFYCSICGLSMNSQQQYDQHINSKKHSTKVTKLSCSIKVESND